jgi:hypothetical protein
MVNRRGSGVGGCLTLLAVLGALIWLGMPALMSYKRKFEYDDAIRRAIQYAPTDNDEGIRSRIGASADSIGGLPDEAYEVQIDRVNGRIRITAEYTETLTLRFGLWKKEITHRFETDRAI